ncbi:hypothetical protein CWR43_19095 [Rhizobium sullae]|uniref:Uncharacterized protein n=1 Tax=Rhizobium sullae TaxID=50338 RepID=A0A2N0D810_RHISU|nr:hypothetical protein CWR43_19095 [Rhizobium sullae]
MGYGIDIFLLGVFRFLVLHVVIPADVTLHKYYLFRKGDVPLNDPPASCRFPWQYNILVT